MMGFGIFFMLLFWGLIVGGIMALVNWFTRRDGRSTFNVGARRDPAFETLRERYARGEITREEYERLRSEIEA